MKWIELKREEGRKEKDLEELVRKWLSGEAPPSHTLVAGEPMWLPPTSLKRKEGFQGIGYRYIPDGVSDHEGRRFVWEFKFRDKGEPIALAEVLHHSYFQRFETKAPTMPVIVGQINEWTRAALAYLIEDGLSPDKIHYLEVDLIESLGTTVRRLLWLDEPLAAWRSVTPDDVPEEVRQRVSSPNLVNWFLVGATSTWWVVDEGVAKDVPLVPVGGGRPLFFAGGRVAAVAKARPLGGEWKGAWIAWQGRVSAGSRGKVVWEESFLLGE